VGSVRSFISGLLAAYRVYSVDIRDREYTHENETVINCDAKSIPLDDESVDAVVTLCSLQHFGLGKYGDEFDLDADKTALNEMIRILKPNGHLIFSTTVTSNTPIIHFNAQRIFSLELIREYCRDLTLVEEKLYNPRNRTFCSSEELDTPIGGHWDLYLGDYRK